jgi:hypothetical protein
MAPMLRLEIPSVELKEELMRASMLAFAGILVCAASAASAQAVIDVEGLRAAQPAQDQPGAQPQPRVVPQVVPQATPKVESTVQSKEDSPAAPAGGGRFTFNRIDNGFLRLDTQSGEVAYCRAQAAGWACQAVPENRSGLEADVARLQSDLTALKTLQSDISALQTEVTALKTLKSEIARLQDEIAAVRREVAALKEPPPPRPPADLTAPGKSDDVVIKLPTHEDIARARNFIEKTWHRLVEMISAVQKDMMQKS